MKKRIFSFIVVFTMLLSFMAAVSFATVTDEFFGGSGTPADPYLISNAYDFFRIEDFPDCHFKLIADIDCSKWRQTNSMGIFRGSLDGDGHSINNLKILQTSDISNLYVGLFAQNHGVIKNLSLVNCIISGESIHKGSGYVCVGSIAGYNTGTISDCSSIADVQAFGSWKEYSVFTFAGGIAGQSTGTGKIERCSNRGIVSSLARYSARSGGIVGYGGGIIKDCYNSGYIASTVLDAEYLEAYGGGIGGWFNGTIENCYNIGEINVDSYNRADIACRGGIVGYKDDNKALSENCYYLDNISVGVTGASDNFIKLTDADMRKESSFDGFDFENTWQMSEHAGYKYPVLRDISINLFCDVADTDWFSSYVDYVSERGIFSGMGDNRFAPYYNITRAQFVQVLANITGADLSEYKGRIHFTDVKSTAWYSGAVNWAHENGIVSGMGWGTFKPDDKITREQMCVMLVNYAEHKNIQLGTASDRLFADHDKISGWASEAVYKCFGSGIVSGVGDGKFDPSANATRAQGATIFTNFHKSYMK